MAEIEEKLEWGRKLEKALIKFKDNILTYFRGHKKDIEENLESLSKAYSRGMFSSAGGIATLVAKELNELSEENLILRDLEDRLRKANILKEGQKLADLKEVI